MGKARSFGFKCAWLAVRTESTDDVVAAIGAQGVEPSSWVRGIDAVYASDPLADHAVFVTPSLDGWVLAASPAFFDEASDAEPERIPRFVTDLSSALETEVQFFATHRVVEGHAWARAEGGILARAFFYLGEVGEVLVDAGSLTDGEESLAQQPSSEPDESTVMSVAAAWSIDPTQIEERFPEVSDGHLGVITSPTSSLQAFPDGAPSRPWWKLW